MSGTVGDGQLPERKQSVVTSVRKRRAEAARVHPHQATTKSSPLTTLKIMRVACGRLLIVVEKLSHSKALEKKILVESEMIGKLCVDTE